MTLFSAATDACFCGQRQRGRQCWWEAWLGSSGLQEPSAEVSLCPHFRGGRCSSGGSSDVPSVPQRVRPWLLPLRADGRGTYMPVSSFIPQVLDAFVPHLFFFSSFVTYPSPTLSKRPPGTVVKGDGVRLRIPALDDVLAPKENRAVVSIK